jgi:hypothetical protein
VTKAKLCLITQLQTVAISDTVEYRGPGLIDAITTKKWFAVFTTPRHEKRVEEYFRARESKGFFHYARSGANGKTDHKEQY